MERLARSTERFDFHELAIFNADTSFIGNTFQSFASDQLNAKSNVYREATRREAIELIDQHALVYSGCSNPYYVT